MTNNRKPVDEVRLSLSAARKREAGTHLYERLADKDMRDKPYTPPPAVAAWLQAQADKPKAGRDIESLMRYHEAHKKGRTDDDCLAEKFGGQPLPSAGHGKDVDTPWPKCIHHREHGGEFLDVYESDGNGKQYHPSGAIFTCSQTYSKRMDTATYGTAVANGKAAQWLEAHGHKDVAAQLRGKDATGGGRVWKCTDGWFRCAIGTDSFLRNPKGRWSKETTLELDEVVRMVKRHGGYTELFGPERDAIVAECRKAMGLCPQKPAS